MKTQSLNLSFDCNPFFLILNRNSWHLLCSFQFRKPKIFIGLYIANNRKPSSILQITLKINAIIFSAISRQNSSTSTLNESLSSELDTSEHDDPFTNNCQISFIESLVDIGRKLVNQPNRESKTTRLVSELNEVNLHLPGKVFTKTILVLTLERFFLQIFSLI